MFNYQWGPFHFTGEISLGAVIQFGTIVFVCFKYLNTYFKDMRQSSQRTTELWAKFHGKSEYDPEGWFNRMKAMEQKVEELWNMQFKGKPIPGKHHV